MKMKKEFTIDLDIYSEELLRQAVSDFSEVWEIILDKNVLTLSWESEIEIEEVFNELMNYVISL